MQGPADTPLPEHFLIAAVIVASFILFGRAVRAFRERGIAMAIPQRIVRMKGDV
jgi:hypothetical protein